MQANYRFAILKWVNYKKTSLEGLEKTVQYICNPKASPRSWQHHSFLSSKDPVRALAAIDRRYKKNPDGRLYKQGIISFGCEVNEENMNKGFHMVKELLKQYRGTYPYIVALHTNVKSRLHAHFVLGMTSMRDGQKFSQSPEDLQAFNRLYKKIAIETRMPPLKGYLPVTNVCPEDDGWEHSEYEDGYPIIWNPMESIARYNAAIEQSTYLANSGQGQVSNPTVDLTGNSSDLLPVVTSSSPYEPVSVPMGQYIMPAMNDAEIRNLLTMLFATLIRSNIYMDNLKAEIERGQESLREQLAYCQAENQRLRQQIDALTAQQRGNIL